MLLTLTDVDQLLDQHSRTRLRRPRLHRLRGGRDDLVHVAVLLSYARHVLSVDIGALQAIAEASDRGPAGVSSTACRACSRQPLSAGMVVVARRASHHRIGPTGGGGRGRRADAGARRNGPPRPCARPRRCRSTLRRARGPGVNGLRAPRAGREESAARSRPCSWSNTSAGKLIPTIGSANYTQKLLLTLRRAPCVPFLPTRPLTPWICALWPPG